MPEDFFDAESTAARLAAEALVVDVDGFEGPLDLLLTLARSQKVDLKVDEITINGDEAQAVGRREDVIILRDGQRLRQDLKFTYTLKRGPRGWVIQEAREYADKAPLGTRAPESTPRAGRRP